MIIRGRRERKRAPHPFLFASIGLGLLLATVARRAEASAAISLSSGAGGRGQTISIEATLSGAGSQIAATQEEIFFPLDALALEAADCTPDPRLAAPMIAKQLIVNVTADTPFGAPPGTRRLRVGVFSGDNTNVIPDGPLFRCAFTILTTAAAGPQTLHHSASASNASKLVNVTAHEGTITVVDAAIDLSGASAAPGGSAAVTAHLSSHGNPVARTQSDIFFPLDDLDLLASDCVLEPRLAAAGIEKSIAASVGPSSPPAPPGTRRLRVGVDGPNANVIPDGVLFTCTFHVAPTAAAGAKPLLHTPTAQDPQSNGLQAGGTGASIIVVSTPPALTLSAASGMPAQSVPLSATLETNGNAVATTRSDIFFPADAFSVAGTDCTLEARLAGHQLAAEVTTDTPDGAPPGARRLRVEISGAVAISDGVLFTCSVGILASASPGTRTLQHLAAASSPEGISLPLTGADGELTVGELPTHSPTTTHTRTRTATITRTATSTRTETSTRTPSSTRTHSRTPTHTATITETRTATETRTFTATRTETRTRTPTVTRTATAAATDSATATATETPVDTPTATPTETQVETPTATETETPLPTQTATATESATPADTPTPTESPTETPTPSATSTAAATATLARTRCPADCDDDGRLAPADLMRVVDILNLCPSCDGAGVVAACEAAETECIAADLDGDGCLTASELSRVVSRIAAGNPCP